jgi:hypothetical protein
MNDLDIDAFDAIDTVADHRSDPVYLLTMQERAARLDVEREKRRRFLSEVKETLFREMKREQAEFYYYHNYIGIKSPTEIAAQIERDTGVRITKQAVDGRRVSAIRYVMTHPEKGLDRLKPSLELERWYKEQMSDLHIYS